MGNWKCRIALETGMFDKQPLEKLFPRIREIGFEYIEFAHSDYRPHLMSDSQVSEFKKLLDDSGLRLASLTAILPLASLQEEERTEAVTHWKRTIDVCPALDCRLITAEMSGKPAEREACSEAFKKSLSELAPALESRDVTACFEPHPGDFLEDYRSAVDLIRGTGNARVRYQHCTPHTFVLGGESTQMIEYAADVLGHVHIADTHHTRRIIAPAEVKAHEHLVPGEGEVDFHAVLTALKRAEYRGFLSIIPISYMDKPEEAAIRSRKALLKLLRSV